MKTLDAQLERNGKSPTNRPRILMLSYYYDRNDTMETRLSWRRAQQASRDYDVTVICRRADYTESGENSEFTECKSAATLAVIEVPASRLERFVERIPGYFYLGYRLWHRRALQLAMKIHARRPFSLVHHVSFCGYREPGDCWQIDAPFLWGPVGGTQNFPWQYLGHLRPTAAFRELARNVINAYQLRHSRRVRRAAAAAVKVLAANRTVARELAEGQRQAFRHELPEILLETGVDFSPEVNERIASGPLRILWSGRLRCWKALPLLLRAVAQLPPETRFEVRIMGEGKSERRWRRLAKRLGIADAVEWVGWPAYADQLPHYQWADVFAFTSLRDTSGTGLLEALAAGTPIVGVDHQGAADVMTDDCAIRIPVGNPRDTIRAFREAIASLAEDSDRWERLSVGARRRAARFSWSRQASALRRVYTEIISAPDASDTAGEEDLFGDDVVAAPSAKRSRQVEEVVLGR